MTLVKCSTAVGLIADERGLYDSPMRSRRGAGRFALWITALTSLAIGACSRSSTPQSSPSLTAGQLRGANVLLVTIDTLRADRVGAYGGTGGLTPSIDRLAASGIRYTHAWSHAPM